MKLPACRRSVATVMAIASALFLASNSTVHAQTAAGFATVPVLDAVQATRPPVIDGTVAETEWQGATVATSFIQFEPRRGERSDIRTESLVLYDAGHLYVAFRAWDSEQVTAQLTQRDADLLRDDAVVLVVDTTNDRRSAYYFITNALGTQADGRIADDGRTSEATWDAPWESAAKPTEYGWSAELSIPLSSVRYVAGERQTVLSARSMSSRSDHRPSGGLLRKVVWELARSRGRTRHGDDDALR